MSYFLWKPDALTLLPTSEGGKALCLWKIKWSSPLTSRFSRYQAVLLVGQGQQVNHVQSTFGFDCFTTNEFHNIKKMTFRSYIGMCRYPRFPIIKKQKIDQRVDSDEINHNHVIP